MDSDVHIQLTLEMPVILKISGGISPTDPEWGASIPPFSPLEGTLTGVNTLSLM